MHNKSFTVDGVFSIVGGRNIGDKSFDLSDEINFRVRDALAMSSVVTDIRHSFREYWNSRWSYSVNLLGGEVTAELPALTVVSAPHYEHYPRLPERTEIAHRFLKGLMDEMNWVSARFVYDKPVPVDESNTSEPKATARLLTELTRQSNQEVLLESAYLIFDDNQLDELQMLTNKGVQIKALTNSMASNDLVTNHSGDAGQLPDMLELGIQLFELKPDTTLCEK
jgi:putative cardiolipin synthase